MRAHLARGAVAAATVLLLAACSSRTGANLGQSSSTESSPDYQLMVSATVCNLGDNTVDGERAVIVDTEGEDDDSGDKVEDVACLLNELKTPATVIDHIDNTRALDGTQTDTWDRYSARWSYHPSTGLHLAISESTSE